MRKPILIAAFVALSWGSLSFAQMSSSSPPANTTGMNTGVINSTTSTDPLVPGLSAPDFGNPGTPQSDFFNQGIVAPGAGVNSFNQLNPINQRPADGAIQNSPDLRSMGATPTPSSRQY